MGYSLGAPSEFKALRTALTTHERERFTASRAASAAVEFAIVGPVLLLLMSGIFTYGGYFLTAHTVQQLANDAARASIAGLDDTERLALARESTRAGVANQRFMRGAPPKVELSRDGRTISVVVSYDASNDLYWAFESLIPTPSHNISRRSAIRIGGY